MEAKSRNGFKAVEYMRQVRNDLGMLYQADKDRFHRELKQTMDDFTTKRRERMSQNMTGK